MSVAGGALSMGRRTAESLMRDTCTVVDPSSTAPVWNPTTLQYDEVPATVYTGKCRLRRSGMQARQGEQAGQLFVEQGAILSLPFSEPTSAAVGKDHVVTVTASESDVGMVGAKFTVSATPHQSDATARRFPVKDTQ